MENLQTTVVVLNYNGLEFIGNCLHSLSKQSYSPLQVVMVDNGSSDGSVGFVERNYPTVTVISNKKNLGFAEGNNVGIRYAIKNGSEFVLLLNNDTIVAPDAVEEMVEVARAKSTVGIVGPLIYDMERRNEIVELGLDCDFMGYPVNKTASRIRDADLRPFYIAGCAMLIKSQVFAAIGLLDPSYFIFVEDLDFCWRARLHGIEILGAPRSTVYHKSGGTVLGGAVKQESHSTSMLRLYLSQKNTMKTIIKNYDVPALSLALPLSIFFGLVTFVAGAGVLRQPRVAQCYLRALLSNVRELSETLRMRSIIQSSRTVPDRQILAMMWKKSAIVRSYLGIQRLIVNTK